MANATARTLAIAARLGVAAVCAFTGACTLSTEGTNPSATTTTTTTAGAGGAGGEGGSIGIGGSSNVGGAGGAGGAGGGGPCDVTAWSTRLSTSGTTQAAGIAMSNTGDVFVTTSFTGTSDMSTGEVTASGTQDLLVARFTPAGALVWGTNYPLGMSDQFAFASAITLGSGGNPVVTGRLGGVIDFGFGTGPIGDAATPGAFVAQLAAATGGGLWSRFVANAEGLSIARDPAGGVIVGGYTTDQIEFGGTSYNHGGQQDLFVARLGDDGTDQWAFTAGDGSSQKVYAVTSGSGVIYATGYFADVVDLEQQYDAGSSNDAFLLRLDGSGAPVKTIQMLCDGSAEGRAVAVDANGDVVVAGAFNGTLDFGGGTTLMSDGNVNDIFLARFTAGGALVWAKRFGSSNKADEPRGVRIDSQGRIHVTGQFVGDVDFGGGVLSAGSKRDVFLAVFAGDGTHLASKDFGDNGADQRGLSLALGPCGQVALAGPYDGALDFGGGNLPNPGGVDTFAAVLEPLLP